MGQKVNPHGLRVGVIKDWDSRWFAKDNVFGDTLVEDYNLRKTLKKQLYQAGIPKIEIERDASKVRIHIHCAKPGMVIGVKESSRSIERIKGFMEEDAFRGVPKWLSYDAKKGEGSVLAMPARDDIDFEVEEHLIVELYSK